MSIVMSDEEPREGAPKRRSGEGRARSPEMAARRHQGRMLAFQVLYEVDLTGHDPEEAVERAFAEHEPVTEDVRAQVRRLVHGVLERRDELDPLIAGAAPARALDEQAAVERNILRIAAFELTQPESAPPKVAINEAVELAKRFGGENSGRFINGVLRTLYEGNTRTSA
jgi:N utilization substance protein B